jgi:hypothetical protein
MSGPLVGIICFVLGTYYGSDSKKHAVIIDRLLVFHTLKLTSICHLITT